MKTRTGFHLTVKEVEWIRLFRRFNEAGRAALVRALQETYDEEPVERRKPPAVPGNPKPLAFKPAG
jgi:hypothetical protein